MTTLENIPDHKSSVIQRLDMLVCNKYLYQKFEDIYIHVHCANEQKVITFEDACRLRFSFPFLGLTGIIPKNFKKV